VVLFDRNYAHAVHSKVPRRPRIHAILLIVTRF
jgi:hypothetical protein